MTPNQKQALLQFFKAVGQPERAKMLGLAASRPHTVIELAELLGLKGNGRSQSGNQTTKSGSYYRK